MAVPLIHLVPYAQSCGIPLSEAGGIILVMLIAGICGRIAFGKLVDMIGAVRAYWVASAWQTVLVVLFLQFQSLESLMVFAVIYGFGYGGVMTTILVSMQVLTPVARRASATGIVTAFAFFGHAIGGYQGGLFLRPDGQLRLGLYQCGNRRRGQPDRRRRAVHRHHAPPRKADGGCYGVAR